MTSRNTIYSHLNFLPFCLSNAAADTSPTRRSNLWAIVGVGDFKIIGRHFFAGNRSAKKWLNHFYVPRSGRCGRTKWTKFIAKLNCALTKYWNGVKLSSETVHYFFFFLGGGQQNSPIHFSSFFSSDLYIKEKITRKADSITFFFRKNLG